MTNEEALKLLKQNANNINKVAEGYYENLVQKIINGDNPRKAIKEVVDGFHSSTFDELSIAFTSLLSTKITASKIKNFEVEGIKLSDRLYNGLKDVEKSSLKVINDYVKDKKTIKELSRALFDGYLSREEIIKSKPNLPKYLIEALESGTDLSYRPKTKGLLKAYQDVLNAESEKALDKALERAYKEKSRYYANRIAQNELWKSHTQSYYATIDTDYVQYSINERSGRLVDICDVHRDRDPLGLGAGIYKRDDVPLPPIHAFCRCNIDPYATDKKPNEKRDNLAEILKNERLAKQVDYFGLEGMDKKRAVI